MKNLNLLKIEEVEVARLFVYKGEFLWVRLGLNWMIT